MTRSALELLYPSQCVGCSEYGSLFCVKCRNRALRMPNDICLICGNRQTVCLGRNCPRVFPSVDMVLVPFVFEGAVRRAIHALKYEHVRQMSEVLGEMLAENIRLDGDKHRTVAAMPVHPRRERLRGFNQATAIAKTVSLRLNAEQDDGIIRKIKNTPSQVSLKTREKRMLHAQDAFSASDKAEGLHVVLVDDVITTGSTVSAAAAALKIAGAKSVTAVALAREID